MLGVLCWAWVIFCKVGMFCTSLCWMDSVGHHFVDTKCWADVETWKVLGSSYTLVDFSLVMESVGHSLLVGKCWAPNTFH